MTTHEELNALLQRAGAQRDRDAFRALYAALGPRVRGWVRRRIGPERADEVTQDVMLRAWRAAPRFDPSRSTATTWVFAIARNRVVDVLRKSGRPAPEPDDPAYVPGLDEVADSKLRAERVRSAIASLPRNQSTIIRRAYFEHRPLPEVARSLDIPLGTVKSRVRLAFNKLRDALSTEVLA